MFEIHKNCFDSDSANIFAKTNCSGKNSLACLWMWIYREKNAKISLDTATKRAHLLLIVQMESFLLLFFSVQGLRRLLMEDFVSIFFDH